MAIIDQGSLIDLPKNWCLLSYYDRAEARPRSGRGPAVAEAKVTGEVAMPRVMS